MSQVPSTVLIAIDAAGLSLFAVAGAAKALEFDIPPLIAVLMGGITGVGGGTVRDILLARVPNVLRSDIYAVAALAGAAVMIVALRSGVPPPGRCLCRGHILLCAARGGGLAALEPAAQFSVVTRSGVVAFARHPVNCLVKTRFYLSVPHDCERKDTRAARTC